ncbi:uncharacterized protein LOC124144083 [Haliotis rufescens]|uniref:uncharacterized protein LOC124144083 n=1 Tax=Haliotis rufescens TaxID=6454 RepID=UPI00201FA315|nr:uncharacterized protein LOC124144083 [Haliotis rufescens]
MKEKTSLQMGLIPGVLLLYLFLATNVLLPICAHDRHYYEDYLGKISLSDGFLNINGKLVCNEGFSLHDAAVVCRQLGKPTAHVYIIYNEKVKANETLRSLRGHGCRGNETRLQQCYVGIKAGCRQKVPISITCKKEQAKMCQNTNLTLLQGKSIRVYSGTRVTATCLARGLYMPSQYWYKWTLSTNNSIVGSSPSISLQMNNTSPANMTLTCSVNIGRQECHVNNSIDIQVFSDPKPLTKAFNLTIGQSLNFSKLYSCNPSCNCTWRKIEGDRELGPEACDEMKIQNISQSGLYIVTCTNYLNVTIGKPRKGVSVDVIKVKVSDKPTMKCPEEQYVILTSQPYKKHHNLCHFNGQWENKTCTWDGSQSCANCSIKIDELYNSGNYTCTAGYKDQPMSTLNMTTHNMTVHILSGNSTVSVMEGSSINLNLPKCSDTNFAFNNYTWKILKEDGEVEGNYSQLNRVNTSAYYVGFSSDKALMRLEVLYGPKVTCDEKVFVPLGTRASLKCSVKANPISSYITWKRGSELLQNTSSETYVLSKTGMLDSGSYICTAYNTMVDCYNETHEGNDSCTTTVDVYVEGDEQKVTVVASVLSLLLVCLMGVVGVLSGLLYRARRGERRRNNPTKMLPLLTKPESVKDGPAADIYENA